MKTSLNDRAAKTISDDSFAVLPTPIAYELITIDDDDGDPIIENRVSAPKTVIGFVIRKHGGYFSVLPVTPSGVHDRIPEYVLVRADGKAEYDGAHGDHIFDSVDDWKQFMRRVAMELFSEVAEDMAKDGDKKGAAQMRRAARAHRVAITKAEGE